MEKSKNNNNINNIKSRYAIILIFILINKNKLLKIVNYNFQKKIYNEIEVEITLIAREDPYYCATLSTLYLFA